ncbi:hypothetical protein HDU97_009154 [Phlyctochytrium planicorne]|nr:hypothetical protein HDU97_009154 [Phlyctochytrium planicorne]
MFSKIKRSVNTAFSDIKGSLSSLTSPTSGDENLRPHDRILRQILAIENCKDKEEEEMMKHLQEVDDEISQSLSVHTELVDALKVYIADKEREWQDHTSALQDDVVGLKEVSWSGWPVLNKMGAGHYHYDFFISYRVSSDSIIARELRLQLILRGFTVFLDQEELKDGEVGSCAFMVSQAKKTLAGLENRIRYWTETVSSCSVVGFGRMFGKDEELERQFYVGTGKLDFSGYPRERASSSGESEGILVCHQSAFTTLVQVTKLKTRVDHPNPSEGFEDSTIDEIAKSLDTFEELHKQKATLRSHLLYSEYGSSESMSSEERSLHLLEKWESSRLDLIRVPQDMFPRIKTIIYGNKTWNSLFLKDISEAENLAALLMIFVPHDLKELNLNGLSPFHTTITAENAYFMQKTLKGNASLQSFRLSSIHIWKFLESLPLLKHISLDTVPFLEKDESRRLLAFLKEHSNIKEISLTDTNLKDKSEAEDRLGQLLEEFAKLGLETFELEACFCKYSIHEFVSASTSLKHLILPRYRAGDDFGSFAQSLQASNALVTLDLTDSEFSQEDQAMLLSKLQSTNIETLKLTLTILSETTPYTQWLKEFSDYICTSSTLSSLGLGFSDHESVMPRETISELFNILGKSKTLSSLHLRSAYPAEPLLNVDSVASLATNLSTIKTLESLHVEASFESDMDKSELFLHLSKCQRLKVLKMIKAELSSDDAKEIAGLVSRSMGLEELIIPGLCFLLLLDAYVIKGYKFTSNAVVDIIIAAKGKTNLRKIDIQGTIYGKDVFDAAQEAFYGNKNLIIYFDCSQDINSLVKYEYILPALLRISHEDDTVLLPKEQQNEAPVISFSQEKASFLANDEKNDKRAFAIRDVIMSKASRLSLKQVEYLHLKEIAQAVENLARILTQPAHRLVYREFSADWPVPLDDKSPAVYFLDSVVAGRSSASRRDKAIVRELKLRLLTKILKRDWLEEHGGYVVKDDGARLAEFEAVAEFAREYANMRSERRRRGIGNKGSGGEHQIGASEDGILASSEETGQSAFDTLNSDKGLANEKEDQKIEEGMEAVVDIGNELDLESTQTGAFDATADGELDDDVKEADDFEEEEIRYNWDAYSSAPTITSTIDSDAEEDEAEKLPKLTVKNMPYPNVKILAEPRNISDDYELTFPDVVIVFLSESILEDIKSDAELFWKAIHTWEYLCQCSDEGIFTMIPVYIADDSNANYIIGKMRSQILNTIYILGRDMLQDRDTADASPNLESLRRAVETVEAIFKVQGVVIDKLQLVQHVAEKIIKAATSVSRNRARFSSALLEYEEKLPDVFDRGLESHVFDLDTEITDENIKWVREVMRLPIFKRFEGRVSGGSSATDLEHEVFELLKKAPGLESVKFQGKFNGMYGATRVLSNAVTAFSELLKMKRLTDIHLELEIEDKKVAPVFCKAIAQHSSLKSLSLKGFAKAYAETLFSALVTNKSITKLELAGLEKRENWVNDLLLDEHILSQGFDDEFDRWTVSDDGAEALCELLRSNETISTLNIESGQKEDEQLETLLKGISSNTHLQRLNSYISKAQTKTFTALASLIEINPVLESLTFGTGRDEDTCIGIAFNAVAKSKTIKEVFVPRTTVPEGGDVEAVLECLEHATGLERISFRGCAMSQELLSGIIKSMTRVGRYKSVDLEQDDGKLEEFEIGLFEEDRSQKQLLKSILRNTTLIKAPDYVSITAQVEKHLLFNRFRKIDKNTREGWQFALDENSQELKDRFMALADFRKWMEEESVWFLHKVCEEGDNEILAIVLETVSDKVLNSAYGKRKLTPLGQVIRGSNKIGFEMLMNKNVENIAKIMFNNPVPAFYYAAGMCGNVDIAKVILASRIASDPWERVYDVRIKRRMVALQTAALYGYHEAVKFLLTLVDGCDRRFLESGHGSYIGTALFYASCGRINGHDLGRLMKASTDGEALLKDDKVDHVKVIDVLMERCGEDVGEYRDVNGKSALDVAIEKGMVPIQEALSRYGIVAGEAREAEVESDSDWDDDGEVAEGDVN